MPGSTDLQRLIVSMEARYTSLERQLAKASGVANRRAREIETRFQRMNTSLAGSFGRLGGILAGAVSVRAAQQLIDASTRIRNSLRVAGLEGSELTRVYEELFASAQRNAAPVEALADLYGRAALVQKELGISTEELLRFTDRVAVALRVSGKSAQESSGALLQLSQALGSGIVRAEEFNSILEGALPIAQAAAAGLDEAGGSVAKLRQLVVDGKVSSEAFFRAFEAGASVLEQKVAGAELTLSQGFVRLQNVLIDAAGKFDEVTGSSKLVAGALNLVAEAITAIVESSSPFMQAVGGVSDHVEGLGASLRRLYNDPSWENLYDALFVGSPATPAEKRLQAVAAATASLRDRLKEVNAETAVAAVGTKVPLTPELDARFGDAFSSVKPVSLSDYAVPSDGKDAAKAATKISDTIADLKAEQAQLGRTAREQAVYNALQKAGITDGHARAAAVRAAAEALYDEERVVTLNIEAMDALRDATQDLASTIIDGFLDGKSATESFGDAIEGLAKRILNSGIEGLIASVLGVGGTPGAGPLGGLASALFGGGRAAGGPINPGRIYKVHKDELIVPRVPGTVIPASQANRGGRAGAMAISIDVRGARGNAEIMEMVSAGVREGMREADRALPDKIKQINRSPRRRGR